MKIFNSNNFRALANEKLMNNLKKIKYIYMMIYKEEIMVMIMAVI